MGYLVELDDVGMAQDLEDADLSRDALDVSLLHYFLLLQCLNCHLLVGGQVYSQPHFPKGSLPDALAFITECLPIL